MLNLQECFDFLGCRIDKIVQPMVNLNVPVLNGITATSNGIQINKNRLSSMSLPIHELKTIDRVWLVGIYDDTNSKGITVFEDVNLHDALLKAVNHIKTFES